MSDSPKETDSEKNEPDPLAALDASAHEEVFEELDAGLTEDENDAAVAEEPSLFSLQKELEEKADQLLRATAEIENVRKRGRREADEARKYASTSLLIDLLTAVDDLDRAVEAAESNEENSSLLAGVKMVSIQLESVLEKNQCKKIDALGKPFDPNLHEAIQMQPSDEYAANHVSLEVRTGYQFHDRVLRTAQVFVSTGSPQN
ncbi:MAG: nucleotide exchange factor GrpE [Planctomycetota bacterium]|nr:nucleotide exchange factor GrpE [Planctomycetota bacterium]